MVLYSEKATLLEIESEYILNHTVLYEVPKFPYGAVVGKLEMLEAHIHTRCTLGLGILHNIVLQINCIVCQNRESHYLDLTLTSK